MGVHWKVALECEIVFAQEAHALALGTKAGVFERQQHRDGVAVVDLRHVHVGRREARHGKGTAGRRANGRGQHVGRIGGRLALHMLAAANHFGTAVAALPGLVVTRDDHGAATGHRHDNLQHAQRLGHHARRQHLLDGDRLSIEHGIGVVAGIETLVHRNARQRGRVVAVDGRVALGNHGVAGVLRHMAVRQVHLCLGRAKAGAVAAKARRFHHLGHVVVVRRGGRHARRNHAHHGVAHAHLDRHGRAPHGADRAGAAQVHHLGKVERHPQVLACHGGHKHAGFMELRADGDQAIDVGQRQAGIVQRLCGQIGHLLQMEHLWRGGVFFWLVLRGANQRRLSFESHGFLR